MLEGSILHHVCIVLLSLLLLSSYNCCHPVAYFVSLFYLYLVHDRYVTRLRRSLRFEERRNSFQRRVLSDSETVRWLNHTIEKVWPICLEQIVSQKVLLPIVPWFLEKYKPWTVKEAVVQHLYMGRSPPIFTEMRVLHQATGDDHLVLELGMNFRTADDMSTILAVKLRKRFGFGMKVKLHLVGMHIEGKVLIGVKFIRQWPFLGRLKVCFVEPPYFQLTMKPVFSHGLDVTELPGIAGWLDKLLAIAFEQTLVEPNMLLVDMEKFVSPQAESWFSMDEKEPVAYALVEVIEAADVKPSDLSGLADPYVKGQLTPYRFRTKTQRKTLDPKWYEEFKIPISTWELPNVLDIEVRDKDRFVDDTLGECSISINDFRDGQRHDMWLPLRNINMGRLHLAITVIEATGKGPGGQPCGREMLNDNCEKNWFANKTAHKGSLSSRLSEKSPKIADTFEPIDIVGQRETGIWVHCTGSDVSQIWEPRKGRTRGDGSGGMVSSKSFASRSYNNNETISSADESQEVNKGQVSKKVLRGLMKIFHKNSRNGDLSCEIEEPLPSPCTNLQAVHETAIGVKLIMEDNFSSPSSVEVPMSEGEESCEGSGLETSRRRQMKAKAESILKHAGRSARGIKNVLSRKWSKKSQGDLGPPLPEGTSVGTETSDEEESLHSIVSTPISRCGSGTSKETSDEEESLHSIVSTPISRCGSGTSKSTVGDPATGIEDQINNKLQSWRFPEHTLQHSVGLESQDFDCWEFADLQVV